MRIKNIFTLLALVIAINTLLTGRIFTVLAEDDGENDNEPIPDDPITLPIEDCSGTRYRKIALNGRPMKDEKPQHSAETSEEKEETYVDAMNLTLHHSSTEIYIPVPGSTHVLSARRNATSEVWNAVSGLRPGEVCDRPFGPCWTTNLVPTIEVLKSSDTNFMQYNVTDENGSVHRFVICASTQTDENGIHNTYDFIPFPSSRIEGGDFLCSLRCSNPNGNLFGPANLAFTGKYGTTIYYEQTSVWRNVYGDRRNHSGWEEHYYLRAVSMVDRMGKTIVYRYTNSSLTPSSISVLKEITSGLRSSDAVNDVVANPNNVGQTILIDLVEAAPPLSLDSTQFSGVNYIITKITDPKGAAWSFDYDTDLAFGSASTRLLSKITAPDGGVTSYTYGAEMEADKKPSNDKIDKYHCDISTIKSHYLVGSVPKDTIYQFEYVFDASKWDYFSECGFYQKTGLPRNISKVTLPDNSFARFQNLSVVKLLRTGTSGCNAAYELDSVDGRPGCRMTKVIDAENNETAYSFSDVTVIEGTRTGERPPPFILCFKKMTISNAIGVETFRFNPNAGMALSSATDIWGHTTTYLHEQIPGFETANSWVYYLVFGGKWGNYYDDPFQETNAMAGVKKFTYGPYRIMASSEDELGRLTQYDLDGFGRRLSESISEPLAPGSPVVKKTTFEYGNSAFPGVVTQKVECALGDQVGTDLVTSYELDANGNVVTETTYPHSGLYLITRHTYDASSNKKTTTDPKGNVTAFDYDFCNRLVKTTYAKGTEEEAFKEFVYDLKGNKIKEIDEKRHVTEFEYDQCNRLVKTSRIMEEAPKLETRFEYNSVNSKTLIIDPNNYETRMEYDSAQRVTDVISAVGTAVSGTTHFEYGTNSGASLFDTTAFKPTLSRDPRGIETTVTYDARYRPLTHSVAYANGFVATGSNGYDAVGNLTSKLDPVGNVIKTDYDALNRPLKVSYYGQENSLLCFTSTDYTKTGLKWKTTDELGRVTETQYDGAGRPIRVIAPAVDDGHGNIVTPITETIYDDAGNVASVKDPLLHQTDYGYNARNRKTSETGPLVTNATISGPNNQVRPLTQWEYDFVGNLTKVTNPNDAVTDTIYDWANRPITVIGPDVGNGRPTTHTFYDKSGNVTYVQDPKEHWTRNTYDPLNRLSSTTTGATTRDGSGLTVSYEYDLVGNRTKVIDGNQYATAFEYDGLNRNTKVTDAAGSYTVFGYDAMDKRSRVDANGVRTDYSYDFRHRLKTVTYSSPFDIGNRTYHYDLAGNITGVSEPNKGGKADVAYLYDDLNRVIAETSGTSVISSPAACIANGVAIVDGVYTYNLAGNRLSALYFGDSVAIEYTYDALNRLETLKDNNRITSYGYDRSGNIVSKTLANGDKETATFDALNRMTGEQSVSNEVVQYGYYYGHDLAGNLDWIQEHDLPVFNQTQSFGYDAANRLVDEWSDSFGHKHYGYDDANNRVSLDYEGYVTTYVYNEVNQLTGFSDNGSYSVGFSYDANGNRKTRTCAGVTDSYSYDAENRLTNLSKGDGNVYAYMYDYRTRRVERVENETSTRVVFSGGVSVKEYENGATAPKVEYIRGHDMGGGVGGLLYTNRQGTLSFDHYNSRGDVVAKTDTNGVNTYQVWYDAFGSRPVYWYSDEAALEDRQQANTKEEDPTGLLNEGFRYRDLETGVFITRDPAGNTLIQPKDKWVVDGKEVSYQEYEQALEPGVPQAGNGPTKTAKDSGQEADHHVAVGSGEKTIPGQKSHWHEAPAAIPNIYTYVEDNPWTKFDPEGLESAFLNAVNGQPAPPLDASDPNYVDNFGSQLGQSLLGSVVGAGMFFTPEGKGEKRRRRREKKQSIQRSTNSWRSSLLNMVQIPLLRG